jgi:hypothetical protein
MIRNADDQFQLIGKLLGEYARWLNPLLSDEQVAQAMVLQQLRQAILDYGRMCQTQFIS